MCLRIDSMIDCRRAIADCSDEVEDGRSDA